MTQFHSDTVTRGYGWVKWVFGLIFFLIIGGFGIKEWRGSQIVGHPSHRFNLALIAPGTGVTFVSFDPTEKAILALPFPPDLSIQSRNSGEYSITSLYKLGSYTGQGGMFALQKIQGFVVLLILRTMKTFEPCNRGKILLYLD